MESVPIEKQEGFLAWLDAEIEAGKKRAEGLQESALRYHEKGDLEAAKYYFDGILPEKEIVKALEDVKATFEAAKWECARAENRAKNFIYPLTITSDRYDGLFSGGKFIAWNLEAWEVPRATKENNLDECEKFWKALSTPVGIGDTPRAAMIDLYNKIAGK